jgi:hypothetical protein
MRFMMLMIPNGYESAAPGTMPDPGAVAAIMIWAEAFGMAIDRYGAPWPNLSLLEPIAGTEDPPDQHQAERKKTALLKIEWVTTRSDGLPCSLRQPWPVSRRARLPDHGTW